MEYTAVGAGEFATLADLGDWRFVLGAIEAEFALDTFPAGAALVAEIAAAAEEAVHHPDVSLRYPGVVRVTLTEKTPSSDPDVLRALLGELCNELLASAWRQQLAREHRPIIEAVTLRAMEGALGGPTLDDLAQYDFGDEALDDPLGIAVAWEDKYGKPQEGE